MVESISMQKTKTKDKAHNRMTREEADQRQKKHMKREKKDKKVRGEVIFSNFKNEVLIKTQGEICLDKIWLIKQRRQCNNQEKWYKYHSQHDYIVEDLAYKA